MALLIEPVQGRHPNLRPKQFLFQDQVRTITADPVLHSFIMGW
jgi:hypothetical protein